jgi:hypothetical protein
VATPWWRSAARSAEGIAGGELRWPCGGGGAGQRRTMRRRGGPNGGRSAASDRAIWARPLGAARAATERAPRTANQEPAAATLRPTGGPHAEVFSDFTINFEISFLCEEKIYKRTKTLGKFMEIEDPIWNTFASATSLKSSRILN